MMSCNIDAEGHHPPPQLTQLPSDSPHHSPKALHEPASQPFQQHGPWSGLGWRPKKNGPLVKSSVMFIVVSTATSGTGSDMLNSFCISNAMACAASLAMSVFLKSGLQW